MLQATQSALDKRNENKIYFSLFLFIHPTIMSVIIDQTHRHRIDAIWNYFLCGRTRIDRRSQMRLLLLCLYLCGLIWFGDCGAMADMSSASSFDGNIYDGFWVDWVTGCAALLADRQPHRRQSTQCNVEREKKCRLASLRQSNPMCNTPSVFVCVCVCYEMPMCTMYAVCLPACCRGSHTSRSVAKQSDL